MELSQGMIGIPLPPILANPKRIDRVVRKKIKETRPTGLVTESLFPNFIPIEIQLGRRHLDALREEIGAAEDVLNNVYEDISVFKTRQAALNEITYFLLRMREYVDILTINRIHRQAIKNEIDLLTSQIDLITETTHRRTIPVLKPFQRIVTYGMEAGVSSLADVVFLIDRDARMKKDVMQLTRTAHVLAGELKNRGVDLRLGVQTFERTSQPSGPLRAGIDDFIADLKAIFFNGATKNTLAAVRQTLEEQSFRNGAHKFIVVFTDSEAHDDYGTAKDETITAAAEADATVFVMSANEFFSKSPFHSYNELARNTGGRYFDLNRVTYEDNMSRLAAEIAIRMAQRGAPVVEATDRFVQIGPEPSDIINVKFPDFRTDTLGLRNLPLDTEDDFKTALGRIDSALSTISFDRAEKSVLHKYLKRILDVFDDIRLYKLDFHI